MSEHRFFKCSHCGNLIGMIDDKGVPVVCCGEPMKELIPNTSDGAGEKHVPVVTREGDKVTVHVGSVDHPMVDEHFIQWVYLATKQGGQRKNLLPGQTPEVVFALADGDEALAAYEYCNLHGLWKTEL